MNYRRTGRISEEIKKVISDLLVKKLKDPRISSMTSVTGVEVTNDLRYAKVYISVLGNKKDKTRTIKGLERASGYIRKEIGAKIDLRYTPELRFYIDKSIENGIYMSKLIEKVNRGKDEKTDD